MQRFINWVLVIGALVGLFYLVGLIVPRSTTRKCETQLSTKPDELYATVSDVTTWPQWYPDVASVRAGAPKNDLPTWTLTFKDGKTALLEVLNADEDSLWQAFFMRNGSRHTVRFVFGWFGQGGRIHLTKTVDTRDPWVRARLFLWLEEEATPLGILNALGLHFGESGKAREK